MANKKRNINPNSLKNLEKGNLANKTKEERKEIARNGANATNKIIKEKANFKNILTTVFEGKPSKPLIEILKQAGIESPDKLNYLEAIIAFGALKTHSKKTGLNELTRFLEFARDSMGQKAPDVVQSTNTNIDITDEKVINKVMDKLKDL